MSASMYDQRMVAEVKVRPRCAAKTDEWWAKMEPKEVQLLPLCMARNESWVSMWGQKG